MPFQWYIGCVFDVHCQSGLQPVFKTIWNSLATVNGTVITDGSEALVSRTSEKDKSKKRKREDLLARPPPFSVNLIQDLVSNALIDTRKMDGRVPTPPGILENFVFFLENSRSWIVLENHFGPGKISLKVVHFSSGSNRKQ